MPRALRWPSALASGERAELGQTAPAHGLLLDEPTLGQDAAHKTILLRLLRQIAHSGQLVLITTHDLVLAAQCDRLVLLGDHGILADGSPQEVFTQTRAWQRAGLKVPNWLCN